ncbi:MAG: hypothetical protein Q9208_007097 [Pyrenodesmia sp. 3 TL-2023]
MAQRRSLSPVLHASGIPSPGVSPTRPVVGSPNKRRRLLRETEDESGVLSIEDYNYRGDAYRSSNMPTKYPLPMNTEDPDPELERLLASKGDLSGQIASLLQVHHIECNTIEFCFVSKPGYPAEGDKARPAVSIWVDIKDLVSAASLPAARRDISDMLEENGLGDMVVDIQDPARAYLPCIYPIRSTEPQTQLYRRVRESLLRVVTTDIPRLWLTLGLHYVGSSYGGAIPAVALVVHPLATHDWQDLRQKLMGIIEVHRPQHMVLDVEIFPGYRGDLSPQPSPARDLRDTFTPAPKMGASIGVVGEQGAGTLGGFFTLKIGETIREGFLTSSHVVGPPDDSPQEVHDRYSKHGVRWDTPEDHATKTKVQYLALEDNIETMESCYNESRRLTGFVDSDGNQRKGVIKEIEEKIQQCKLIGKDSTYWHQEKALAEATVQDLWDKYLCLEKMPQKLGSTVFASGQAVIRNKKKIMDWAFVSCAGHSPSVKNTCSALYDPKLGNVLPSPAHMKSEKLNPEMYFTHTPSYLPRDDLRPRRDFGSIEPDQWYFKVGRTTGITAGICNGIETYVNTMATRYVHDRQGKVVIGVTNPDPETKEDPDYTEEWVIINAHSDIRIFTEHQTFCLDGDSGSLIIDIQGRVCGLLFGSISGWQGPRVPVRQSSDPNTPSPNVMQSRSYSDDGMGGKYMEAGLVMDIGDVVADIATRALRPPQGVCAVLDLP